MFMKFDCGCIGVPTGKPFDEYYDNDSTFRTHAAVLVPCDDGCYDTRSPDSLTWALRYMKADPPPVPLTFAQVELLHQQIARRFQKADRFENVCIALGVTVK